MNFYPRWVRALLLAGVAMFDVQNQSKHSRQRQVIPEGKRKQVLKARHKRGRKVTVYELGR